MTLILSLFPGIDLLGRAFEEVWPEACLVRGPDLLWGGNIKGFNPPAGAFNGIIAGVPCQRWSPLVHMVRATHGEDAVAEDMFPEFERVVGLAQPDWFLTDCSPFAPIPNVSGYAVSSCIMDNRWIGDGIGQAQRRRRRFCFGTRSGGMSLDVSGDVAVFESGDTERAVIASSHKEAAALPQGSRTERQTLPGSMPRRSVGYCCELQGLPPDFLDHAPFTSAGKYTVIGNGVAMPTGRAIARAVKKVVGEMG